MPPPAGAHGRSIRAVGGGPPSGRGGGPPTVRTAGRRLRSRPGRRDSESQVITVEDTTAPTLSGVPAAVTVECDAVPAPASPSATDNCDGAPAITFAELRTDGTCANSYTLTRTWTATDDCGNAHSESQVVTVQDTTAPVLSGNPGDLTVECDAVPDPVVLTASDACDADVPVDFQETDTRTGATQEDCANYGYVITRTWTATDDCGNQSVHVQLITVEDTTAPVLTLPADLTLECAPPFDPDSLPPATATDNCDRDPEVVRTAAFAPDCGGTGVWTFTWTATDACGNATSADQTVTIVDTTPPALMGVPASVVVECDAVPAPATVTAMDGCEGRVDVAFDEVRTDGSCPSDYVLTRTWSTHDACGNTSSATQVVTVEDTTAPSLAGAIEYCVSKQTNTYACFDKEDFLDPAAGVPVMATDNCSPSATGVEWRFVDCSSRAPDEDDACGRADGGTVEDCKLTEDGQSFCVRPELSGNNKFRYYDVSAVAVDECGNESDPVVVGTITITKANPGRSGCIDPPKGCIQWLTLKVSEDCMDPAQVQDCYGVDQQGFETFNEDCIQQFVNADFNNQNETTLCITINGIEYCDRFHVSCSECLQPGDLGQFGCLEIVDLDHDGRMDTTCGNDGADACLRELTLEVVADGDGECVNACLLPDGSIRPECIASFGPEELTGGATEFCIYVDGQDYCGTFDVSCNTCLAEGDEDRCLRVRDVRARDGRLTEACCQASGGGGGGGRGNNK